MPYKPNTTANPDHSRNKRRRQHLGAPHAITCILLLPVILRCLGECFNILLNTPIPVSSDFTLSAIFSAFSLSHAITSLGLRRALSFFGSSVLISFFLEAVGVRTGWISGLYHYTSALGPMLCGVPVVIPLAWFMMLYPSWMLAVSVLPAKPDFTFGRVIATAAIGSMAMTAWDATEDPMAVAKGEWVWDQPGMYFGIPVHNFAGWLLTTGSVFVFYGAICSRLRSSRMSLPRWYASLPLIAYGFVALARIFISVPPPVRIFAFFSMGLAATISASRVLLEPTILDNLNHSAGDLEKAEDQ